MKLHIPGSQPEHLQDCRRGEIDGFSRSSRRHLLQLVNSFDRSRVKPDRVFTFTLTYPVSVAPAARASKRDLQRFLKRLRRSCPEATGFWKLEPQLNGSPHYHLLLVFMGERHIDALQLHQMLADAWCESVRFSGRRAGGSTLANMLKVHHHRNAFEQVRSFNGIASYAAKYIGKEVRRPENWGKPGKWWDVISRDLLPVTLETFSIPQHVARLVKRVARRLIEKQITGVYIPGRQFRGAHRPGQVLPAHMRVDLGGQGAAQPVLQAFGPDGVFASLGARLQRRRRRRSGGVSMFISSGAADRVLRWAWESVGGVEDPAEWASWESAQRGRVALPG